LFAEAGAKAVYICDYDDSNLETHKRELNALYPTVDIHVRQFDAADEKSVKAVVDHAIERYGRLDVFFANAGIIGPHALFTGISKEDFMKVLDTNTARFVMCMVSDYMPSFLMFPLAYSWQPNMGRPR